MIEAGTGGFVCFFSQRSKLTKGRRSVPRATIARLQYEPPRGLSRRLGSRVVSPRPSFHSPNTSSNNWSSRLAADSALRKPRRTARNDFFYSVFNKLRFARTLRHDTNAAPNAGIAPWSSGLLDGRITRLKMLKPSLYGVSQHEIASRAHATATRLQFAPSVKPTPKRSNLTACQIGKENRSLNCADLAFNCI